MDTARGARITFQDGEAAVGGLDEVEAHLPRIAGLRSKRAHKTADRLALYRLEIDAAATSNAVLRVVGRMGKQPPILEQAIAAQLPARDKLLRDPGLRRSGPNVLQGVRAGPYQHPRRKPGVDGFEHQVARTPCMLHHRLRRLEKHGWRRGYGQVAGELRESVLVVQARHQVEVRDEHPALPLQPPPLVRDVEGFFARGKYKIRVKPLGGGKQRGPIFVYAPDRLRQPEPALDTV